MFYLLKFLGFCSISKIHKFLKLTRICLLGVFFYYSHLALGGPLNRKTKVFFFFFQNEVHFFLFFFLFILSHS